MLSQRTVTFIFNFQPNLLLNYYGPVLSFALINTLFIDLHASKLGLLRNNPIFCSEETKGYKVVKD